MTPVTKMTTAIKGDEQTAGHHDVVEAMLKAIVNEVAHADLWDAHYDVQRLDPGKGTGATEVSPRYSVPAKRRSRTVKR
jgi:hypothetical protein